MRHTGTAKSRASLRREASEDAGAAGALEAEAEAAPEPVGVDVCPTSGVDSRLGSRISTVSPHDVGNVWRVV